MDDTDIADNVIHIHCETCIKVNKCSVRPKVSESCHIISCAAECGAKFHACKYHEHKLLCRNEKVPCINSINGCPLWFPRHQLGQHLETCPASVVHCTMEWNRWPVCSRERQMHIPFRQPNPHARPGQLDVALALRDQRMLNDWLRAPRRTRRALRNSLTRRFPAVPLQIRNPSESDSTETSNQTSRTVTDDEEDTPWEMRKTPPGLQRSVCGELYRASKQATDSLTAALNIITNHSPAFELPKAKSQHLDLNEDKENLNRIANGWSAEHHLNRALHGNHYDGMEVEFEENGDFKAKSEDMELHIDLPVEIEPMHSYDVLFVENTVVSEISSASMTDHARKQPSPPPPPPPSSPPMFVNLGLDLTLESITRYQAKPKSMYTFLCAQEFRRDEYSWHYKNVHSDIHGGLNGWLEQRCPLAHYGCMYSLRRFHPTRKGASIVHNDVLESFGVQPLIPNNTVQYNLSSEKVVCTRKSPSRVEMSVLHNGAMDVIPEDESSQSLLQYPNESPSLNQLPFEVLQHIARFLDSFSLCNLALSSRLLREVCCSLLEERGIVVQQWERHKIGRQITWKIAYKRWFFSTAFTPIEWWGFEEKDNMANHLKICTYFQRNQKSEPYFYPMGIEPNPTLYEKLKSSMCSQQSNGWDNHATKL